MACSDWSAQTVWVTCSGLTLLRDAVLLVHLLGQAAGAPPLVQAMVNAWEAGCGKLDQYGMQYTRLFANLCNAGAQPPLSLCVGREIRSPAIKDFCMLHMHACPCLWLCNDVAVQCDLPGSLSQGVTVAPPHFTA